MTNIVDGLTNIIPVAPMLEDLVELVAHQFLADTESKTTPFRVGITKRTFHDRLGTITPKNNGGGIVKDNLLDFGKGISFALSNRKEMRPEVLAKRFTSFFRLEIGLRIYRSG